MRIFGVLAAYLAISVSAALPADAQTKLTEEEMMWNLRPGSPSTEAFDRLRQMQRTLGKGKFGEVHAGVWLDDKGNADGLRSLIIKICEGEANVCVPHIQWDVIALPTSQGGAIASISREVVGRPAKGFDRFLAYGKQQWGAPDESGGPGKHGTLREHLWHQNDGMDVWLKEGTRDAMASFEGPGVTYFFLKLRSKAMENAYYENKARWVMQK